MAMSSSARVTLSIAAVLLAAGVELGCGPDEFICDFITNPYEFEVIDEPFDLAEFTEDRSDDYCGIVGEFTELNEEQQCRAACLFVTGHGCADDLFTNEGHPIELDSCQLEATEDARTGTISCAGSGYAISVCGRRPLACPPERLEARGPSVQAQLDAFAQSEYASITAFVELAAELERHGAPSSLVRRCIEAARDERRHFELLVELGATPSPLPASAPTERPSSLGALARHNVVAGCTEETWAALVAHHQAARAESEAIRRCFAEIAADETRHAELAWDLHAYFVAELGPALAAELEQLRVNALASLVETLAASEGAAPSVRACLGLPDPALASGLARSLGRELARAA